jgi:hypothetical protein
MCEKHPEWLITYSKMMANKNETKPKTCIREDRLPKGLKCRDCELVVECISHNAPYGTKYAKS